MGPPSRISCSICSRRDGWTDKRLAPLASLFVRRWTTGFGAILRSARKHFDEIVVQSVIELALKMPGELGMIEVAGMNRQHVGVNGDGRVLQIDQNFDGAAGFARGKGEQGMIVELEVFLNHSEFAGAGHASILLRMV
jgi:hypothetical protein